MFLYNTFSRLRKKINQKNNSLTLKDIPEYLNNHENRKRRLTRIKQILFILFLISYAYLAYYRYNNSPKINPEIKLDSIK